MKVKHKGVFLKTVVIGGALFVTIFLWPESSVSKADAHENKLPVSHQKTVTVVKPTPKQNQSKQENIQFKNKTLEYVVRMEADKPIGKLNMEDVSRIENIDLSDLAFNDFYVKSLDGLQNLKKLNFCELPVYKDTNLDFLKNLKHLQVVRLFVNGTLNEDHLMDLKKALPNCFFEVQDTSETSSIPTLVNDIQKLGWKGYRNQWCPNNIKKHEYQVEFDTFEGTELYRVVPKKTAYSIRLNTNLNHGKVIMKIYNDEKMLYEMVNPSNQEITISKKDAQNIRIECIGQKAKGTFCIQTL